MITSMSLERQKLVSDEDFEETQDSYTIPTAWTLHFWTKISKKKYGNNTIATIDL